MRSPCDLKHRKLLDEQAKHKREGERDEKKLSTLRPALWKKLELPEEAEVEDDQATFDSVKPTNVVEQKIKSLEDLKAERKGLSKVKEMEDERDAIQEKINGANAEIKAHNTLIEFF